MVQTDAQRRAALAYRKKSVTQLSIALYPADQDIIDHLAGMKNKAAYIRELIRKDIRKGKKDPVPFGCDLVDGELVVNEKEAELLRRALEEALSEPDPDTGETESPGVSIEARKALALAIAEKKGYRKPWSDTIEIISPMLLETPQFFKRVTQTHSGHVPKKRDIRPSAPDNIPFDKDETC